MPGAPRLTHTPSYFHRPKEQGQDSVLEGHVKALVTWLLLFGWNCQGLMTDKLLISFGRREDEQSPGAVKERCDLCPGRLSKPFLPHPVASYPPAQPQQVRQRDAAFEADALGTLTAMRRVQGLLYLPGERQLQPSSAAVAAPGYMRPPPATGLAGHRQGPSLICSSPAEKKPLPLHISAWTLPFSRGTCPC